MEIISITISRSVKSAIDAVQSPTPEKKKIHHLNCLVFYSLFSSAVFNFLYDLMCQLKALDFN